MRRGAQKLMKLGVDVLPRFPQDTPTATAPRPLLSPATSSSSVCSAPANSIACANIMLNTAVAELEQFADELEGARTSKRRLHDLISDT